MAQNLRLNRKVLSFSKIWFLDAVNGNDTTGDGSIYKPYKTFLFFVNKHKNDFSNTQAIYLAAGNYSYVHNFDANPPILPTIVGELPFNTILTTAAQTPNRAALTMFPGTSVINVKINHDMVRDVNSYLLGTGYTTKPIINIYNCILNSYYPGNATFNNITLKVYNSFVLYVPSITNGTMSYVNSVYPVASGNYNLNLTDITYDSEFNLTSGVWEHAGDPNILNPDDTRSNIGIYGGPYMPGFKMIDWGFLNKNLIDDKFYIIRDSENFVIEDNLEFTTETGSVIPHEIVDYFEGKIRIKIPVLNVGDNKIYLKYKTGTQIHSLELPEGVTETVVPISQLKSMFETAVKGSENE
jgi:hypothetical protein